MRKKKTGSTGIVIKNDVHARGCPLSKMGVARKHKCEVCKEVFSDTEDVYYAFSQRGTMSAASSYIHPACIATYRKQSTKGGLYCRLCEKEEPDMRILTGHARGFWIHEACLENVDRETVPVETIPDRVRRRYEARFKRIELFYGVTMFEDGSLYLDRNSRFSAEAQITVRMLDGKLKRAYFNNVNLFIGGHWTAEEDYGRLRKPEYDFERAVSEKQIAAAKEWQEKLQKYYDKRGYPIGDRLDADFKLRFLLENGNSVEGIIYEATE